MQFGFLKRAKPAEKVVVRETIEPTPSCNIPLVLLGASLPSALCHVTQAQLITRGPAQPVLSACRCRGVVPVYREPCRCYADRRPGTVLDVAGARSCQLVWPAKVAPACLAQSVGMLGLLGGRHCTHSSACRSHGLSAITCSRAGRHRACASALTTRLWRC